MNGGISNSSRFPAAIALFDQHNAADPNVERAEGRDWPRELFFAHKLSDWVEKLCPGASEELHLAARCQHLCRWEIPRSAFPMTRAGYLQWRTKLKSFHAEKSGQLLRAAGYPEDLIIRVQNLNLKKNFPKDADSRVLEDALCLVFLQYQFAELARKTDEDKMINALRKSWAKMTPAAHEIALAMSFGEHEMKLINAALKPPGGATPGPIGG